MTKLTFIELNLEYLSVGHPLTVKSSRGLSYEEWKSYDSHSDLITDERNNRSNTFLGTAVTRRKWILIFFQSTQPITSKFMFKMVDYAAATILASSMEYAKKNLQVQQNLMEALKYLNHK